MIPLLPIRKNLPFMGLILFQSHIMISSCDAKSNFLNLECTEHETFNKPKMNFKISSGITINGSGVKEIEDDIVISSSRYNAKLSCYAPYPIDMNFVGHVTSQYSEVNTKVTEFISAKNQSGHCYKVEINWDVTLKEITGNYSCFSVEKPFVVNSKYIYAFTPSPGILMRSGENLTIYGKPGENVVLPCAVSNPEAEVVLTKVNDNDNALEEWVLSPFDPKVGFTIVMENATRTYKCKLKNEVTTVRVLTSIGWAVKPRSFTVQPINDTIHVKCSADSDIEFNLKPNFKHNISLATDIYKFSKQLTGAPSSSGEVSCVNKTSNKILHTWSYKIRADMSNWKPGVLDPRNLSQQCPRRSNNSAIILFECHNPIECNLNRCLRQEARCESNVNCVTKLCFSSGWLQCVSKEGVLVSETFFTGFDGNSYTSWKAAGRDNLMQIRAEKTEKKFQFSLECEGKAFVLASGFQWKLLFNNGSAQNLEKVYHPEETVVTEIWGAHKDTLISRISFATEAAARKLLNEDLGLRGILCRAPVWSTSLWINQSIPIQELEDIIKDQGSARKNIASNLTSEYNFIRVFSILHCVLCCLLQNWK